jgi:hypothetical protein
VVQARGLVQGSVAAGGPQVLDVRREPEGQQQTGELAPVVLRGHVDQHGGPILQVLRVSDQQALRQRAVEAHTRRAKRLAAGELGARGAVAGQQLGHLDGAAQEGALIQAATGGGVRVGAVLEQENGALELVHLDGVVEQVPEHVVGVVVGPGQGVPGVQPSRCEHAQPPIVVTTKHGVVESLALVRVRPSITPRLLHVGLGRARHLVVDDRGATPPAARPPDAASSSLARSLRHR